jgi:hypothetical protein
MKHIRFTNMVNLIEAHRVGEGGEEARFKIFGRKNAIKLENKGPY